MKPLRFAIALMCMGFPAAAQPAPDPAAEAKIHNIENDIAPFVLIKGQVAPRVSLADRMYELHVPGVSVAFIHDGKIAWARGFGVTRIGGARVTPDTLFQAGSISKPVTAMAVLHLVQSGQLDLDANVNQYLKTWKLPENSFTAQKPVTLRELLSHTAGVTVHGFPGYASGGQTPTLVQVLDGEPPANTPAIRVDTTPGTIWRYSGGGYVITQQLLLDVTGKSFPSFMHDTVLGPIGMMHSTYEQPLPAARAADAAVPYGPNGVPVVGGPHTYPEMAPAGLWTTPSDLARYAIEVQKELAGQSNLVLSKAMAGQMVKTVTPGDYGLGLELGGSPDHPYFQHGGLDEGFASQLTTYDKGDGVVIMTSGMNGGRLAQDLVRTIAREYQWPDFVPQEKMIVSVDEKKLARYVGRYQMSPQMTIEVTRDGDHLYGQGTHQDKFEMFAQSDRDFFLKVVDAEVSFIDDGDGAASSLVLHQNGQTIAGKRLP